VPESFVRHHRSEVGAPDTDVHDVSERLSGVALPLAGADSLRERSHALQGRVHLRDDVDPVDDQRAPARHPQGDVQDGAVLGRVDPIAPEHRLGALGEAGLLGELHEQVQRLVDHAILGVVEVEAGTLGHEALAPRRVVREEIAQMRVSDERVVELEGLPRRAFPQRRHFPATSRATVLTASGVKPNFCTSSLSGADAPNVFIATIAPASPT
jgi:hypothetical protein